VGVDNTFALVKNLTQKDYFVQSNKECYKQINDSIYYINIDKITKQQFEELIPILIEQKGIILDFRGYPKMSSFDYIPYLINKKEDVDQFIAIPVFLYPDREKMICNYTGHITFNPKGPHIKAKIVCLIDGAELSATETHLIYLKELDIATIIGSPTSGATGSISSIDLLGEKKITFTGMKAIFPDKSEFHRVGIKPDIYIQKTVSDISNNKDPLINCAIEYLIK
ncbi:MAG: S41 family peptidase, partial [Bacteroidota bacterium]